MMLVLAMAVAALSAVACSASGTKSNPQGSGGAAGAGGGTLDGGPDATIGTDAGPDSSFSNPTTVVIGPGADKSAPGKFGGGDDPSAKPQLVYPASGIIVPPNMNSLEFHYTPGAGQTLFELRFEAATLNFVIYFGCQPLGTGCVYTPAKQFWGELVKAARGKAAVKYTLRGVNGQSPGAVGTSDTHEISFTKEDINGGLYYWNTTGVIQRYDFGYPLKQAELFMNAQMAGGFVCVGCHALSRDGSVMAVGSGAPLPAAPYGIFDVATRKPVSVSGTKLTGAGNFFSFSPDAKQLLYSNGAKIGWRDLTTGQTINDNVVPGAMPDWSPSGSMMVFARPSPILAGPGIQGGAISLMDYDQPNQAWKNPRVLVPASGGDNYYPAFDPSGNWVVFNRSAANHSSYENIGVDSKSGQVGDGELWAVNVHGNKPIRLDNATKPGAVSWAKWAPDIGTYWGGTVMWLTFSSARAYGLRLAENQKVQLWMVAFDPDKAQAGKDPSFPAFWLPFQDINGGNHIAQWVTHVERQPCTTAKDCAGNETCSNGKCVPVVQ
jgi:TolB protein